MNPSRKLLGRHVGVIARQSVYETPDAVEVESHEGYDVTRKRVLFEEVVLVTFHRAVGLPFVIVTGLMASFFGGIALILLLSAREPGAATTFGIFASPFLIVCALRLILRLDIVTVFGRRSKATLRFAFRKRRAREVYGRICARAIEVQRSMET